MIRFKFLTGDVNARKYGAKWVSQRLNNGKFDYWLVMEVINWHEATGDESADKYSVSLCAVSPESVSQINKDHAIRSCGWDSESYTDLDMVEILHSYGISAYLWQGSSNSYHRLMREARKEAQIVSMLFGFYMDTPENRIGDTGWQRIRGESITDQWRKGE